MADHMKRNLMLKILFLILVFCSEEVLSQSNPACLTVDTKAGQESAFTNDNLNPANDRIVLMVDAGGINCQGVITEWRFYKRGARPCNDITFQVYRHDVGNDYMLIGQNHLTNARPPGGPACVDNYDGVISYKVKDNEQIPVQPGDIIAWKEHANQGMLGFRDNAGSPETREVTVPGSPAPGDTPTFNTIVRRDVYLTASVRRGAIPTFDNLDSEISVYEGAKAANTDVFVVRASYKSNVNIAITAPRPIQPEDQLTFLSGTLPAEFNYVTQPRFVAPALPATFASLRWAGGVNLNYDLTKQFVIPFTIHDGALSSSGTLTINVLDTNLPHTIDPFTTVTIDARLTKPRTQIMTATVTDPDLTNITKKQFTIVTQTVSGTFIIDHDTGELSSAVDLNSVVRPVNDRDNPNQGHTVTIRASDGVHWDDRTLNINMQNWRILPVLIGAPGPLTTAIDENIIRGAEVYKLGVVPDPDRKSLTYEIRGIIPHNGWLKFNIDPSTGSIYVPPGTSTDPVFHQPDDTTFDLAVGVTDDLYSSSSTPGITLRVTINWVNKAPEFDKPKYQEVSIPEELVVGSPVLTINPVYDRDVARGLGGDFLTYAIVPNYASPFFRIAGNILQINQRIDIDPQANKWMQNMTLTIRVRDNYGESDTSEVRVIVTDINDNAPVFTQTVYTAQIEENSAGGTPLTAPVVVTATDADSGINAELVYSIQNVAAHPDMDKYFQVHPTNGEVTVRHPMDYEGLAPTTRFQFNVFARDERGEPSGNLSPVPVTVTVDLIDVNDNRPEFTQGFYNLEARADLLLGYEVVAVYATDADTPPVSVVSYFILIPEPDFAINENNGSITVNRNLKEEHKYLLYCYARDNGVPELLSTPSIVRIDAYSPWKYLIDIELEIPQSQYSPAVENDFMNQLNIYLHPWVVKRERTTHDVDKTTVTIYALHDNSTDDILNIDKPKHFVWRDDLLGKLRIDIIGTPKEEITRPPFDRFRPIKVMPTYPIWIIDTIPGIVTLSVSCFLALLLIILLIVCLMKRFQVCCFKPKPVTNVPLRPPEEEFKLSYNTQPEDKKPTVDRKTTSLTETPDNNVRARPRRPPSAETIHSLIYVPHK